MLTARKAGRQQEEYIRITFLDLLITSYETNVPVSKSGVYEIPVESCTLNFARFFYEYRPQRADGTLDGAITAGYDQKANKAL